MTLVLRMNISTSAILLLSSLILIFYRNVTKPTYCETRYDGKRYYSCIKNGLEWDGKVSFDDSLYQITWGLCFIQSVVFWYASCACNNFSSPFKLKHYCYRRVEEFESINDLVELIESHLTNRLDTCFIVKDLVLNIVFWLHFIAQLLLSLLYNKLAAVKEGLTDQKLFDIVYPATRKCSFESWPYELECEEELAHINQAVFAYLWIWFVSVIIVFFVHILYKIFKVGRRIVEQYFRPPVAYATGQEWLYDMCKRDVIRMNNISCFLGIGNFASATNRLMNEPRLKKFFSKKYGFCLRPQQPSTISSMVDFQSHQETQV